MTIWREHIQESMRENGALQTVVDLANIIDEDVVITPHKQWGISVDIGYSAINGDFIYHRCADKRATVEEAATAFLDYFVQEKVYDQKKRCEVPVETIDIYSVRSNRSRTIKQVYIKSRQPVV